jgi:hypothetical protein
MSPEHIAFDVHCGSEPEPDPDPDPDPDPEPDPEPASPLWKFGFFSMQAAISTSPMANVFVVMCALLRTDRTSRTLRRRA